MSDNVIAMPPRNSKQALIAQLKDFIDQAERDQISSMAVTICRPSDEPNNPPTSHYRWCASLVLLGALRLTERQILEDHGDDTPDRWSE